MPENPPSTGAPTPAPEAGDKKRVLIVEDERPLAHALQLKLAHDGFAVTVANTGADGLKEVSENTFDLVLLDLILPEMDGFELLSKIREKQPSLPVVVLSNLGQDEDMKRVEPFNITQYYVKSNMPLAAIVSAVGGLLKK